MSDINVKVKKFKSLTVLTTKLSVYKEFPLGFTCITNILKNLHRYNFVLWNWVWASVYIHERD